MNSINYWICSQCGQPNDVKDRTHCLGCGKKRTDDDQTSKELKTRNVKKTLGVID